jgi:hypothetical protein
VPDHRRKSVVEVWRAPASVERTHVGRQSAAARGPSDGHGTPLPGSERAERSWPVEVPGPGDGGVRTVFGPNGHFNRSEPPRSCEDGDRGGADAPMPRSDDLPFERRRRSRARQRLGDPAGPTRPQRDQQDARGSRHARKTRSPQERHELPEKARQAGIEPTTVGLEIRCSIRLSYWREDLSAVRKPDALVATRTRNTGFGGQRFIQLAYEGVVDDRESYGVQTSRQAERRLDLRAARAPSLKVTRLRRSLLVLDGGCSSAG